MNCAVSPVEVCDFIKPPKVTKSRQDADQNVNYNSSRSSVIHLINKKNLLSRGIYHLKRGAHHPLTGIVSSLVSPKTERRLILNLPPLAAGIFGVSLLIFLYACEQPEPPAPYNREPTQSLRDLKTAWEENRPESAVSQLENFSEFTDQRVEVNLLKQNERDQLLALKLNPLLVQGKLTQAEETLDTHIQNYGLNPFTERAAAIIEELKILKSFPVAEESANSDDLRLELEAQVISQLEIIQDYQITQDWLARQKAALELMRQSEIERDANLLLLKMDRYLAERKNQQIPPLLNSLSDLRPNHFVIKLLSRLPQAAAAELTMQQLSEISQIPKDWRLFCMELALLYHWQSKGKPELGHLETLLSQLNQHSPVSISGMDLRARTAAVSGDYQSMIEYLQLYLRAGGALDREFYFEHFEKLFLDSSQVLARPWLVSFPAATDFIMIVMQLSEKRGTNVD